MDEIQETREIEQHEPKVRLPITSKNNRNHNGAKTSPTRIVYSPNLKAQKVIIKGTVFPWAEKGAMGFVASGESIQGAIECSEDEAEIKCHECGEWRRTLGMHINTHKITATQYRTKHSLTLESKLASPASRSISRRNCKIPKSTAPLNGPYKIKECRPNKLTNEAANLKFACMAQLTERLTRMAAKVGRTPTQNEMRNGDTYGKIHPVTIRWAFRMTVNEALKSIGLTPRKSGILIHRHTPQRIAAPIQLKILQLRAKGLSYKEIGEQLGIDHSTARRYTINDLNTPMPKLQSTH